LILAIKLENRESSTIELLKPFTISHLAVLEGGFDDVAPTWLWDPHVSPFLSTLFLLSPADRRPPPRH
jgi:hypothetical protein